MMRSLWSAASGMRAQQANVDTISNNLANVNTNGFKSNKAEFKTLLYQTVQERTTSMNGETKPIPAQVGLGTRLASTTKNFSQGALLATENYSDFAIEGDGFFQVRNANGNINYTRSGNFLWTTSAQNGRVELTTQEGYPVLDRNGNTIMLPADVTGESATINRNDGTIGYYTPDNRFVSLNQQIGMYQFRNPSGLNAISNNLYEVTDASGQAMNEYTNNNLTRSKVVQGFLEGSNVSVADEMVELIVAQRAYEMNSKAIQATDEMLGQANQLRR
ncbi:MAG: flagellar basal-body rod protein FlgG [Lachnospiraceae bacterium]|nr:flagellar basal-body rod protein FlgG [Lachnospiraceae bacterium]MBQ7506959.1 flagellar basal-body rod protein FlgG [Lachnospiraceae bacterium]